ncbi:hypothetical protein [Gemmatimonas sp.]|uniref:hypothetical protein n=1 Tax=Gemmatimonas sp. TaxID=1962908 RepID=UPI003F6FD514
MSRLAAAFGLRKLGSGARVFDRIARVGHALTQRERQVSDVRHHDVATTIVRRGERPYAVA